VNVRGCREVRFNNSRDICAPPLLLATRHRLRAVFLPNRCPAESLAIHYPLPTIHCLSALPRHPSPITVIRHGRERLSGNTIQPSYSMPKLLMIARSTSRILLGLSRPTRLSNRHRAIVWICSHLTMLSCGSPLS
jgi:hypothetical protein